MNKIRILSLLFAVGLLVSACATNVAGADLPADVMVEASAVDTDSGSINIQPEIEGEETGIVDDVVLLKVDYDAEDLNTAVVGEDTTMIDFDGEMITITGGGADVQGNKVTVFSPGSYQLSGYSNDAKVVVNSAGDGVVSLIFDNLDITSLDSAPIYVLNAEKVVISLAEDSTNVLTDGVNYFYADAETTEPNAAIFSNDDLTINGTGSLTVNANYKHGIVSNDDLMIISGDINIIAAGDGIKGKDLVAVKDGSILINAGYDGVQAYNAEDADKGNVLIDGGVIRITSALDGIQAENVAQINGGEIDILAGGGHVNATQVINQGMGGRGSMPQQGNMVSSESDADSVKGIKAGEMLVITGGNITIDAVDDALHSNGNMEIRDGVLQISSGDDGLHADLTVVINGGDITVVTSVEGIESESITMNAGNVILNTLDDGTNAVADGSVGGGQDDGSSLIINGGYLQITTGGDGFDSNGSAIINGGTVVVDGPSYNGNGPLDVNGSFDVNGGVLIATGSAGMAEAPSESSLQNSVAVVLDNMLAGGTTVRIETSNGEEVASFTPEVDYQLVVFSSPMLETGASYQLFTGKSLVSDFTIAGTVTTIGSFTGNMGGGFGGRGGGQRPGGSN